MNRHDMKRLAFIRYLYVSALAQSRLPAPLKAASVLTMHDAVELFLQLASEHLNVGKSGLGFMEYGAVLDSKLGDQELAQWESMRRLNAARVALKHHGVMPSDADVESLRGSTTAFFQENTEIVFDVQFESVSLVEFVSSESARSRLHDAEALIEEGEVDDALGAIAEAFVDVMSVAESRILREVFPQPRLVSSLRLAYRMRTGNSSNPVVEVDTLAEEVEKSFAAMQEPMLMHILGIDLLRYAQFKDMTPVVHRFAGGNTRRFYDGKKTGSFTADDARFCMDFVISSSFSIDEFGHSGRDE